MFTKKPAANAELVVARNEKLEVLRNLDVEDALYEQTLDAVERLSKLAAEEAPEKLSINTLLPVIGTVASVILIIGHERANVLTTKALAFLPKLLK